MSLTLPTRYEQLSKPISGGMGSIILCRDKFLERTVAIKILQGVTEHRRLLDELNALQGIRSKHVVEIFDVVSTAAGKTVGIVQDFVPGEDLFAKAKSGLSGQNYLKAIFQIACGIADIHARDLIHRDVKPNNMKVDAEGIVKIFDFGLSRYAGDSAETKGFVGTRGFAAPELFGRGTVRFTKAIDTYAFGATCWYLSEKSLPPELVKMPPDPMPKTCRFANLSAGMPPGLADTLDKTLSVNPVQRPEMKDVADSIGKHLLFGKHRAILTHGPNVHEFSKVDQFVNVGVVGVGSIKVRYNGLGFVAEDVKGEIFVNYGAISDGFQFPGSCVLAIGSPERGSARTFVTLDVSHPEVVL